MPRKVVIAGTAAGLACLVPLTALAQAAAAAAQPASAASAAAPVVVTQEATPATAPAAPTQADVQQVIVTAQKRREDIRDVPIAVSVVTGEQLQNRQILDVEDLTRNIPNISFSTQAGPGLGTVEIRGVSSQAGSATVSVYLDDVSLTTRNLYSQGTAEPNFFDLDHVEVLRGPQGTLYGASSLGGTIKFISNQPDLKNVGGYATGELSFTDSGGWNNKVEGVLNLPLSKDTLALRLGVQAGHDSGYIDQVDPSTLKVIQKDINWNNWVTFKAALKAKLGQDWTLTPALLWQDTHTGDIDAAYLAVGDYQTAPGNQTNAPLGRFQTSKIVREPGHDVISVPSLTLTGDVGFADLTGIYSGYYRSFDRTQDGTEINSAYIGSVTTDPALQNTVANLPSAVDLSNRIDGTSLELRLTSKDYDPKTGANPLSWIAGVYTSNTETQVYDNEPIFGITKTFADAGQNVNDPADLQGSFPGAFVGDSSYYSARHYHDKQSAGFGELTWHFRPTLSGTVGLRYAQASQHFTREGNYYYAGGPSSAVIDTTADATTPRFAVNWQVAPETNLYGNIAKGFRFGGANRPVPDTAIVESDLKLLGLPGHPPATFDPDSTWNYEVGSKSDLWGHRVMLNLAAFYIRWNNLQQDITLPNAGFDFETNTGNATSYGLEAELRARVSSNLSVFAAGGWTHATFSEDVPALGFQADGVTPNAQKGDPILGVPVGNANLGADYHWAVTDAVGAFLRGNLQWTGKSHGSLFPDDKDYIRPSYFTVDASAGANYERWEVTAFVKNLTNNETIIQHPSIQNVEQAYYLRPRTIGVSLNYNFF
jgi:outer membrane receptor protein involved in Fe transport